MVLNIPESTLANVLFDELENNSLGISLETVEKAKEGDADKLYDIGLFYHKKFKNYSKAMAWYQLAANKNHAEAKNNIGYMLHGGYGVPVDYCSALKWFVQAAKDESENAILNVGECFEKGHGVPVDKMKALEWYSRINTHSPNVTRISLEGYTLTNEQKEKPLSILIDEVEQLLAFEEAKETAISNIESLSLSAPGKSYKIQIEIQPSGESPHHETTLQVENRALRDTCKQLNAMLVVIQRSNEHIMTQIDNKSSDTKINQLEHENAEMKSKIESIEKLLKSIEETKPADAVYSHDHCGKDNTDLCYDG